MMIKKLFLTAVIITLAAGHARAQEDSLHWWWSPGLGVYASTINETLARDLGLARPKGLLVLAVARSSAAEKAGLQPGDIIEEWSPREIWTDGGKAGTIQIVRDGAAQSLPATSAKMPTDAPLDLLRRAATSRDAQTHIVDPAGAGSFRTLTAALVRSQPGDAVILKPGRYNEGVLVPPGVSIRAAEKSLARIESKTPWLLTGPGTTELTGIVFSTAGLLVENGENVSVSDCEFLIAEKKIGMGITSSKGVRIMRSTFRGAPGTTGISVQGSQASVADSILLAHGNAAIVIAAASKAELSGNLMDGNNDGVLVYSSELTATKNVMSGTWTTEARENTPSFGFRLEKAPAALRKNVIRRHRYGILITEAPAAVNVSEGTVTQGEYGIVLIGSPASISDNLIMQNLRAGIYVSGKESKTTTEAPASEVSILRNTVSNNEGVAIRVDKFRHVTVKDNLIEANVTGVDLDQSGASVENNTMVLQRFAGLALRARSDAKIFNNVLAFNSFGLSLDVNAKYETGYNNVYGNLASTEFPLLDGNYRRADRYVTRDGKKVPIDVYPAYDLKADTDVSVDPGFVKLGSDYNLLPASAIAKIRGKEGRYLGAYAPESYVARSGVMAEEAPVKSRSLSRRGRTARATTVNALAAPANAAGSSRRRVAANPLSAEAKVLIERGDEYMARSRWADAIAAYQQAIQADGNNAKAHNALGWAYNRMNRHGDAFAPLVKAIQLDPQLADAHYGIAYAYLGSDNYAKAIVFLKTTVRLDPRNAEARFSLGEAYLELGNPKGAMEQYLALKDLDANLAKSLLTEIQETP